MTQPDPERASPMLDSLMGAVDRSRVVDRLATLVACPSVTFEPSSIADVIQPWLADLNHTVTRVPCEPDAVGGHPDYSPPARVPDGGHDGLLSEDHDLDCALPRLLLFAHTDTEPVHPGWEHDPLSIQVDGARASGLGVADDKAGVVAIIEALEIIRATGRRIGRRPVVLLAPGKQGGALGTLPGTLAAEGVTSAVYAHPAESRQGFAHLKVASRGIVRLQVDVPGKAAEPLEERTPVSADPRTARNPLSRAARIAQGIESWRDEGRVWAVTAIQGGGVPFDVPAHASLEIDCWFTRGDPAEMAATVARRLALLDTREWDRAHPVSVRLTGLRARPADATGSPLAREVADIVDEVSGQQPSNYAWHSASDIRFPIRALGVPAVGLGGRAGGFYGPGEWVDLTGVDQLAIMLATLLLGTS